MACFEDDGLVVVGLYADVWELVMLEGVGGCITAPTLVAGAGLREDEEIGCLEMVREVVGSQFLTEYGCLEAVLFVSGADSLMADKDGCSLGLDKFAWIQILVDGSLMEGKVC